MDFLHSAANKAMVLALTFTTGFIALFLDN